MFWYDKDQERVMQHKKREIIQELEDTKNRILKELSGVDKVTLTRLREVLADYNRIDHNINEKIVNIETYTGNLLQSVERNLEILEKAVSDYSYLSERLEEMEEYEPTVISKFNTLDTTFKTFKNEILTNTSNSITLLNQTLTKLTEIENTVKSYGEGQIPVEYVEAMVQSVVDSYVENNDGGYATLNQIRNDFENIMRLSDFDPVVFRPPFRNGAILTNGSFNNVSSYISTDFIKVERDVTIIVEPQNGHKFTFAKYSADSYDNFISRTHPQTDRAVFSLVKGEYFILSVGYDDVTELTPMQDGKIIIMKRSPLLQKITKFFKGLDISQEIPYKLIENTVINGETGLPEENMGYCVTDFIDIKHLENMYVSHYRNVVAYDENKAKVKVFTSEKTSKTVINFTSDIRYIRFSIRKNNISTFRFSYDDYESENFQKETVIHNLVHSKLNNKTVYGFGDSLIYGHYSGVGAFDLAAEKHHINYIKYAKNGGKICNTILSQITEAPSVCPDVVFFNGSTNDAYVDFLSSSTGEITTDYTSAFDVSTFCGCFETICKTLKEKYTGAKIIYVSAHKMPTRDIEAQETVYQKAKEICKKWNIYFVDIYNESPINTRIDAMKNLYSYNNEGETSGGNGTHLTGEAYEKFYAPLIIEAMEKLI